MKLSIPCRVPVRGGFTLAEILIAVAVFMLLLVGVIASNLFGLRMVQVNQNKLSATEWSRQTFGKITDEIHSCSAITIGNMDTNSDFVPLSVPGELQQGTAIQIQPSTNSTSLIYYFLNPGDQTFRRSVVAPGGTNTLILADSVTNQMVFDAQDLSGQMLTNSQNNQVIHLTLDFYQPAQFTVSADNYKLETSATRRAVQ
jgi:hypothetical protein